MSELAVSIQSLRRAWAGAPPAERVLRSRQLFDVLLGQGETSKMTYEEFLAWADEDTLAEWVDGEAVVTSPASDRHQDLARFLIAVTSIYVETHGLGVIRPAPFQMKLDHGREPDVLFVAAEHLDRLKTTHLDGPADLVIEIVSAESVGRDRGDKFYEYARGGVPEYWLIDPQAQWAEFYRLYEGHYRLAFEGQAGQYQALSMPGFWLRVEWLWQDPLPDIDDVLLEIGGEVYARRWIERLRQKGFLPPE
ncbi:MAG: Uma2 family endonuclease [Thermoflexales bacterium]|nr:Uma2 family endonuclease [Thermoflexales bacterium]